MLDAIAHILSALASFFGLLASPAAKKVEEVLPEKSESEKALEALQGPSAPKA